MKQEKNQENQKWLKLLSGQEVTEADIELTWETKILRRELEYRRYPPILDQKILANALAKSKPVDSAPVAEPVTMTAPTLPWWRRGLSALFNRGNNKR